MSRYIVNLHIIEEQLQYLSTMIENQKTQSKLLETQVISQENKYNSLTNNPSVVSDFTTTQSEKQYEKLIDSGHTCICVIETYPIKITWCGKTMCKNMTVDDIQYRLDRQQKQSLLLMNELDYQEKKICRVH